MKRSVMIFNIASIIANDERMGLSPYEIAVRVLDRVETLDMAPPGYMKPIAFEEDGKQYPLIPGDFKDEKGIWCTPGVREWEDE